MIKALYSSICQLIRTNFDRPQPLRVKHRVEFTVYLRDYSSVPDADDNIPYKNTLAHIGMLIKETAGPNVSEKTIMDSMNVFIKYRYPELNDVVESIRFIINVEDSKQFRDRLYDCINNHRLDPNGWYVKSYELDIIS